MVALLEEISIRFSVIRASRLFQGSTLVYRLAPCRASAFRQMADTGLRCQRAPPSDGLRFIKPLLVCLIRDIAGDFEK